MNEYLSRLAYLYKQYADGNCTHEERAEFMALVSRDENVHELNSLIHKDIENGDIDRAMPASRADEIFRHIMTNAKEDRREITPVRKMFSLRRIAAAVIIIVLGTAAYFYFNRSSERQAVVAGTDLKKINNDVEPGGNKAILTLANGGTIILDSAQNGVVSQQGNVKVMKLTNGEIAYNSQDPPGNTQEEVQYNTITTPRGGQYQIVLADGSKVWLNAESSLHFPMSFNGKERSVVLTGEAYFEVAKNPSLPFRVTVHDMTVEVLGTHFNVNAYADEEEMKTTLLEGSVKVLSANTLKFALIKPGEQAILSSTGTPGSEADIEVIKTDVDAAVAWKNGLFNFNDADLQTVLRQLTRWYDVKVAYEGSIPKRQFEGKMQRDLNLSEVLKILEKNNVHFKIEGRKIVVTP